MAYHVSIDWSTALRTVTTAATVEVDVMPHLARVHEGGSFPGYYNAVADLGSQFVRFSPWYAYPKVNVAELTKADCANGGSSWNATLLNGIVADFMEAVCGPEAADGKCSTGLSVVPQLSTMPAWMYEPDGSNRTALMPDDPWKYPSGKFGYYVVGGKPLVDPTCREMARYAARYVSWFTQGGMTDECGVHHVSNLHYKWELLSVLNEDEYRTPPGGGVEYTLCWDAWREEIAKVHPTMKLVGPETAGGPFGSNGRAKGPLSSSTKVADTNAASTDTVNSARTLLGGQLDYSLYFLNGSHHSDGQPPPYVSNHVALYGPAWGAFFTGVSMAGDRSRYLSTRPLCSAANVPCSIDPPLEQVDEWVTHVAAPLEDARKVLAPHSQLVMNEFIPFNNEWCDTEGTNATCDWGANTSIGAKMNRKTLGWNAAGASFAYAFGKLSEMGFAWVGADQLIGGPYPDNEPAVASLDWTTGEPNAKYWAVHMLSHRVGATPRELHTGKVSGGPPPPAVGSTANGTCGNTNYGGDCSVQPRGAWNAKDLNITSVDECVAKCAGCKKCNFISFSTHNSDCSWYESCDWKELEHVGAGYVSKVLHAHGDAADALYALGMRLQDAPARAADDARDVVLLVSKSDKPMSVVLDGGALASAQVLDVHGTEPGMEPPYLARADAKGTLALGPFAVALVSMPK